MDYILKVKIVKNEGCEQIELGKECEAVAIKNEEYNGYKVFHHSGLWWLPLEYCELLGKAFAIGYCNYKGKKPFWSVCDEI